MKPRQEEPNPPPYDMTAEEIAYNRKMIREHAPVEQQWRADAACIGIETAFFFPEYGTCVTVRDIKAVCEPCPVRRDCFDYANANHIEHGWWSGMSGLHIVKERNRGK